MEREAVSTPEPEVGFEECTLADLDAYKGVISDPTGDYEAGRTLFFPTTEEFLDYLASFDEEQKDSGGGDANLHGDQGVP